MTTEATNPASTDVLTAARVLLAQLGVSPEDLTGTPVAVPTFAEIVPQVRATLTPGTLRTYDTHLVRLETAWGTRQVNEPSKAELEEMARAVRRDARANRASRGGTGAVENFLSATRRVYRHAEDNGWIQPSDNPARRVPMPKRGTSRRHAIASPQLAQICEIAAAAGNDPELDSLLLRLHIETACRRGGALELRPMDLDPQQCLIWLREKDGTDRWQPVSPTLMRHLLDHATQRHATHSGQLLRYSDGRPITKRRYDHLWARIGEDLPWVTLHGITAHWLRHTTLTWVERTFSYALAQAYAGHRGKTHGTTLTYVKADITEIATALAVLTGEPHPLAPTALSRSQHDTEHTPSHLAKDATA
ncbi:tyrosine-type recombinase/integrase [Nocardia vaccinii]|uniref:tyrosine-type recombinase/integrase n=1 Tax=Nocardia vaccinii TaxID=1822 RepID=UPI0008300C33|nr:site-specific integrase [Nocardia vaccinii]